MKPNWKDAPEWANWLAMDADGSWWWYTEEPLEQWNSWSDASSSGKGKLAECEGWQDTLEERPKPPEEWVSLYRDKYGNVSSWGAVYPSKKEAESVPKIHWGTMYIGAVRVPTGE